MGTDETNQAVVASLDWERRLDSLIQELRVSNGTPMRELSTAILRYMSEGKKVRLSVIGSNALNVAIKAVGHAQSEAVQQGKLLYVIPSFDLREVRDRTSGKDVELTSIQLIIGRLPVVV